MKFSFFKEQFEEDAERLKTEDLKTPSELGLNNAEDFSKVFKRLDKQNLDATAHLRWVELPIPDMLAQIRKDEEETRVEFDELKEEIERVQVMLFASSFIVIRSTS